jgi:hypothetical protein
VQVGKFLSLSDFIEVEDVLLEDNEKRISDDDCGFFCKEENY